MAGRPAKGVTAAGLVATACLIALLMGGTTGQASTIYKWTDAQGRVHYGDEPPPGQRAERIHADGRRSQAGASERVRRIRCRDFRGALEQLDALDDVEPDDSRWLTARALAQERISQWCDP
ncbi:MAG: DUF4124 domain-containing protein [Ectothiorhodospiraceae bacterium]|nr:DUF4124 domain-containing protein [Ectothiorhodospiraceae bacterium]